MPLDTSIYSVFKPRSVADYEAEFDDAENRKIQREANRLALTQGRLKMDEYQRGVQRQNALQGLTGQFGADPNVNAMALERGGYLGEAKTYRDAQADQAKKQADAIKVMAEALDKKIAQHTGLLSMVNSKETAAQWMAAAYQDPDLGKILSRLGPLEQVLQSIPEDPQGLQNWVLQSSAGADKLRQQLATEARDAETKVNNLRTDTRIKAEGAAGRAVQMRGQNMTDVRAREQNANTAAQGKIPAGYRQTPDGNLEAIPGGPADLKLTGQLNQDTATLTASTASMDRLATAANEAMNHPGLKGITGLRGAVPNIPGSDAADAQALLNTLKSQVAFGVLQEMRNNSKTGGALGNVSDAEGKRLEANLAALEKAQSLDQMRASLGKIISYTEQAKDRLRGAYNLKHSGKVAAPSEKPAGASTKTVTRTGTLNGRKVIQYSDGTTEYAD